LERCRRAMIESLLPLGDDFVAMSFTGGVATLQTEQDTVDTLLARADRALYAAKDEGRNRVGLDSSSAVPKRPQGGRF
ncbi:MAG: diguanylate cyclase, partial [Actinomycetes bacterium]